MEHSGGEEPMRNLNERPQSMFRRCNPGRSVVLCSKTECAALMKKGKRGKGRAKRGILIGILISP